MEFNCPSKTHTSPRIPSMDHPEAPLPMVLVKAAVKVVLSASVSSALLLILKMTSVSLMATMHT